RPSSAAAFLRLRRTPTRRALDATRAGRPPAPVAEGADGEPIVSKPLDGSRAWDFLTAFFAARRSFLAVFRRYESRVLRFAREAGVHRDDLVLGPKDLAALFRVPRLHHLRDERFEALRRHAHALFRESGVVEPLDTMASHAFHEASIL